MFTSHIVVIVLVAIIILSIVGVIYLYCRKKKAPKRNIRVNNKYSDPNDAISGHRTSTYSTPYDKRSSKAGVVTVKHIASRNSRKSNKSKDKVPAYLDVNIVDNFQMDEYVPNILSYENQKLGKLSSKNRSVVYNNIEKDYVKNTNSEIWNGGQAIKPDLERTTKENVYTAVKTDSVPSRGGSARKNFPTAYSVIELE